MVDVYTAENTPVFSPFSNPVKLMAEIVNLAQEDLPVGGTLQYLW